MEDPESDMSARIQEMAPPYLVRGDFVRGEIRGGAAAPEVALAVSAVRAGLPWKELDDLRDALDLPMEKVAAKVGMSRATLHRRQKAGVLSPDESDKALRLARILGHAVAVFGDEPRARLWMKAPQLALGGETPLDYAGTEVGAREVDHLIGRIDYGVYS
jgi:putative toxin-antitoxin system antitoxin component (TIGR02293 family)